MPTRFFIVVSWGPRLSVLTCLPQGTREVIVSQQMIRRFWIQMPLQQNGFALSITLNTAKVIKGHNLEKICKTFNKNLPELKSLMLVKLQLGNFLKAVASLIGYLIPKQLWPMVPSFLHQSIFSYHPYHLLPCQRITCSFRIVALLRLSYWHFG